MDNRISSIIKRSMKIVKSYLAAIIILSVFSAAILGVESAPYIVIWVSLAVFLMLCLMVYSDMRNIAFKENRPQYNINPPPFKGLLYGIIGVSPILMIQAIILLINIPAGYFTLRKRIFQLISGPFYWIAKACGGWIGVYLLSLLAIVIVAFLGYFAGHRGFYITAWYKSKFGKQKTKKA